MAGGKERERIRGSKGMATSDRIDEYCIKRHILYVKWDCPDGVVVSAFPPLSKGRGFDSVP